MFLALLAGCPFPEEKDCDASAAVSVTVAVEGPSEPTVTYLHEGVEQACDAWPDGTWACGYEVAGEIVVRAVADGWATAEETVTVEAGECHVEGRRVTLVMESGVECTDEERASIVVSVAGSSGEDLTGVAVTWEPHDDGVSEPAPCDGEGASWTCGADLPGTFDVYAVADGHAEESALVTVPMREDGCHVVTQDLAFELEWLPD